MARKNDDNLNILDQSFFILFEDGDERFVLYLLEHLPNIS